MDVSLLKKPSAVIPLVISFAALTLVLFFLYKWLPRKPNEALRVLALQAAAALVALAVGLML
jgi:uncharacterized BrkB/YihY/UPF0761 family membrane protein